MFLRGVKSFSWLIRMITECLKDMTTFSIVLIIGCIAFADAFKSIDIALVLEDVIERRDIQNTELDLKGNGWYYNHLGSYVKYW